MIRLNFKINSSRNQVLKIQILFLVTSNVMSHHSFSTLIQPCVWFCVYFAMSLFFFSPTLVSLPAHSLSGKEGETLLSQCSCWLGVSLSVIFFPWDCKSTNKWPLWKMCNEISAHLCLENLTRNLTVGVERTLMFQDLSSSKQVFTQL